MIQSLLQEPTFTALKTKMVKFANSVDPDEVAHNEPPHLVIHCLPSSLLILIMVTKYEGENKDDAIV